MDATLNAAPSSTKNKDHARDPVMHQTRKDNQWHLTAGHPHGWGMKAHTGVDKDSRLVHTLTTTPANASDISQTPALLHGQKSEVWADAGYVGVHKREDMKAAQAANDQTVQWHASPKRPKRAWRTSGISENSTQPQENQLI